MEALRIDLPTDPADLDPDFLKEKISLCRNYLNEVGHYWQDALIREASLAVELDALEAAFEIRSNELLSTDPSVAARPSIADRHATIATILRDERQRIAHLKGEILRLSHVKRVVKFRKGELDNTMGALRLQRSLLRDQVRTGAFYGDESETSRGRPLDPADGLNADELEALIASSEQELEAERIAATIADPTDTLEAEDLESIIKGDESSASGVESSVVADADDQAIARFLKEPDDDLESILASI
jgi:hypothetical protein